MIVPEKFLKSLADDDERIFARHIIDIYELCEKRCSPTFSSFMDMRRRVVCEELLSLIKADGYAFFGGYENAERTAVGFFPEYSEPDESDFPICCVKYCFRKSDELSHRDILGALMSLRIKREMTGDILIGEGKAEVMVCNTVAGDAEGIVKIGRIGVSSSVIDRPDIIRKESFQEISGTVSSMRLDCIAALAMNVSREKASAALKGERVAVNYRTVTDNDSRISEGDIISVRGSGKFIVREIGGETRKGRIHIILAKYV